MRISGAHRLWRCLPPHPRQALYARVTEAVAPKPEPIALRPERPWTVAGVLSSPSGLGEAARLAIRALKLRGEPVRTFDLTAQLRQTQSTPAPEAKPMIHESGTLLLFVNPPNVGAALAAIGRSRLVGKQRIGCWVWELDSAPSFWGRQAKLLHRIVAPSRFAAECISGVLGHRVNVIRHPVGVELPALLPRPAAADFHIGAAFDLGSTVARKNPFAVVHAFQRAFSIEDPVRLSLKVRGTTDRQTLHSLHHRIASSGARIDILASDLDRSAFDRWWASLDLFVSLHRAEGFGLLVAEALLRAIPVVVTDWSATREYVDETVGWPVAATLRAATDPSGRYEQPGSRWADPDLDAAAVALREAWLNPDERTKRGRQGRERVSTIFSAARFVGDIDRLDLSQMPQSDLVSQ